MLDAKELDCFAVGENEWVIRRTYRDEQGRRCHQFLAHVANTTTNNQEVAEEFIKGIAALQELGQANTRLQADGANSIPSPCPFHFYDTDGVHVVMVDQCNHPKRKEWRERPAAKA